MLPLHNVIFFTTTGQLSIWQCLHWIFTVTYCIVYNYSSQYTNCAVYIRYPFHNVIFIRNDCTIHSTTMFTAYPQHIHTVLFTITLPSILTLLLHMLSFSQYDIFSQLLHNWLYNNVYSISSTYTYGIVNNYTTQYADFAVYICFPFHNVNIFPHITVQLSIWQCLHSIFSVYILYCLQLLSTVYWLCSVYIYFPSTMIMF